MDITDTEQRRTYLESIKSYIDKHGYPECDPELIYKLVDAMFLRDKAEKQGYDDFADELQALIDKVLAPIDEIDSEKVHLGTFTDEEVSIPDTNPYFQESIGNFVEKDGTVIHGGDIANEFITATDLDEAQAALKRFEKWYREDLERMIDDQKTINGLRTTYERDEFIRIALYNALRRLLYRRKHGDSVTGREMRVP